MSESRSDVLTGIAELMDRYRVQVEASRDVLDPAAVAEFSQELAGWLQRMPPEELVRSLEGAGCEDLSDDLADLLERPGMRGGLAPDAPGGDLLDRLAAGLAARAAMARTAEARRVAGAGKALAGPARGLALGLPMAAALVLGISLWWGVAPVPSPEAPRKPRFLVRLPGQGSWLGEHAEVEEPKVGGYDSTPLGWYREGNRAMRAGRAREAAEWYRKSAVAGFAPAQNELGVLYANGLGVEKSFEQAVAWVRRAAERGVAAAQLNLAVFLAEGPESVRDRYGAVAWYLKAAEAGSPLAQNNLSALYVEGDGVDRDLAESVRWVRRAAEAGEATAEYNLGLAYEIGSGIEADPREARNWFRRAAEHGLAAGQYKLGTFLAEGRGGESDPAAARLWLRKAAEQGHDLAQERLAALGP